MNTKSSTARRKRSPNPFVDEREIPEGRLLLLQARQELASVISSDGYAMDGAALHRLGVVLRNIEQCLMGAPLEAAS